MRRWSIDFLHGLEKAAGVTSVSIALDLIGLFNLQRILEFSDCPLRFRPHLGVLSLLFQIFWVALPVNESCTFCFIELGDARVVLIKPILVFLLREAKHFLTDLDYQCFQRGPRGPILLNGSNSLSRSKVIFSSVLF